MLTETKQVEYEALRLKVLERAGPRAGLAKMDANPADKAKLRELIGKMNANKTTH